VGDRWSAFFVGGLLLDVTGYSQDDASKEQVDELQAFESGEVRAIRVGVVGTLNFTHPWSYVVAGAYRAFDVGFDTDTSDHFTVFDLALGIPIPRAGRLTVGKMKEPFSMERIMSLALEQFMERPAGLDALLPSRNVGMRLSNTAVGERATWAVGWYNDWIESGESFRTSSNQYIGRVTALPLGSSDTDARLHVGISLRGSDTRAGIVRFKAAPESFFAPEFVTTGDLPAEGATWLGLESSFLRGPLWLSSELVHAWVSSARAGDPRVYGVHLTAAWAVTGEARGYDRSRGIVGPALPARDVLQGGIGLWELAARVSRVDLSDVGPTAGAMDRWSAGLNWYPTAGSRLSLNYGFVRLDRFNQIGHTHILQMRLQLLLG
jgi:phosphate-selective porin OprO/OprP